jgi:hypothetical protein
MVGQRSPKPRAMSHGSATRPSLPTPIDQSSSFVPSRINRPLDLDGMTVMSDVHMPLALANQHEHLEMEHNLQPVRESSEEGEVEDLPWGNAPATATWAPMMEEVRFAGPMPYLPCLLTPLDYRSLAQTGVIPPQLSSTSATQTPQPPQPLPPSVPSGKRATNSSAKSSPTIIVPLAPQTTLLLLPPPPQTIV